MDAIRQFVATKALIVNNGKVLLLRESSTYEDGTNASRYDFPGGRLAPGEHFKDALAREVREETGLTVRIGKPVSVGEWRPLVRGEQWQIVATFFECFADDSTVVLSKDHNQYEWIDPKDYEQYSIIENLRSVFKDYLER